MKLLLVVVLLLNLFRGASGVIGSLIGGSITWRLHPQFEANRIIIFKVRTPKRITAGLKSNV
jgi:hypothetical protein